MFHREPSASRKEQTVTETHGEPRVLATDAAIDLIREIRRDHPDILFHQSGGCCDGSSPMCYPADDYIVGDNDVKLGEIDGVPVYISASQYEVWKHTQLIIDVVPGRGGMFSLDNGREKRFLTRSRLFGGGEACAVPPRALPRRET
ncbi:hypothetical protein N181_08510 [Sinorhizobium fredii USDA 205]|uniref:DUF779 domain-containing protein n=1 Tax=Rhizobium fredii TaxID=380 RepID=UPI0006805354|nr:hypothetical protein N181_08510 [Sinorhizobium fredii USDA 205]